MKSFRQFIIKNTISEFLEIPKDPKTNKTAEFDWSALRREVRRLRSRLGRDITQKELDKWVKTQGKENESKWRKLINKRKEAASEKLANQQGKFDAQSEWPSSFDDDDPTDVKKPKNQKLGDTTKGGKVKTVKKPNKPPGWNKRPFGKPTGIDPGTGTATYVPPKDVPKSEKGRRAKRQKWDYEKVKSDIDKADLDRLRKGKQEYSTSKLAKQKYGDWSTTKYEKGTWYSGVKPDRNTKYNRVDQGEVSRRARKYTQKINQRRITSDADKVINKLRKASKLQARMDKAVSTSQKPGTLSQKTNELLRDLRLKGKPKSSVIGPKTYLSKGGQTSLFPDTHTVTPPPEPKTQRTSNWRKWRQTTLDFNKKTPKVTKNPQKTFNQMQKDISRIRGTQSTFPKSNLSYKIKKWVTKIPKAGIEPLTAIQGYARQRDVKNATPARAITGGLLKGRSWWTGFNRGSKLSTAAALKVTKHPAYVAGAGLVGGLTGGYLTSTGTEFAFDQLLGKRGTRTQTQTEPQKTKKDTKVITANPKNNKGIILPPEGKKKKEPFYFGINPAKVSK